jgi:hypothetical protein
MTTARFRTRRLRLAAPFLLAAVGAIAIGIAARAAVGSGSPTGDRLHRQVGVMEGIIDKVLLDSPNFVVTGRDDTRGVLLPDYGVVFSFNASVNNRDILGSLGNLSLNLPFNITTGEDGTVVIGKQKWTSGGDSSDDEDEDSAAVREQEAKAQADEARKARKQAEKELQQAEKQASHLRDRLKEREKSITEWNKERDEKAAELYAAGKQELLQVLLDYGETLAGLKDGEWIVLAGFFDQGGILEDKKASRLVLRVKIDDLRAYAAGRLTESAARDRIIVEEY